MAADVRTCPACGAALELASTDAQSTHCSFCGWTPPAEGYPSADPNTESRFNAETLPLPKEQAAELELGEQSLSEPVEAPSEPSETADSQKSADEQAPDESHTQPADGPAHFRQLTKPSQAPSADEELLEQVPEDLRGVLAARMQAADEAAGKGFRPETVESLKARGYQVTEDARGARITGGDSRSSDFSPHEMVRMAAEQEGGVQPRHKLPICPECQAASPVGAERCQWCDAELSHE